MKPGSRNNSCNRGVTFCARYPPGLGIRSISGLVVEYIVAIDVTRVRFPADALLSLAVVSGARRLVVQSVGPRPPMREL